MSKSVIAQEYFYDAKEKKKTDQVHCSQRPLPFFSKKALFRMNDTI